MSSHYNNAGRSLIVDEVIEVKKPLRKSTAEMQRIVDAQLLRRDTSAIRAQIVAIGSDDLITPIEKQVLSRELRVIASSHAVLVPKAEAYALTSQYIYTNYLTAYQELTSNLEDILEDPLADTPITSHDALLALFDAYYLRSALLEEEIFQFTTGLLDGLDDRMDLALRLTSSTGLVVPLDNSLSTLSAMLLRDGEDKTGDYGDPCFTWERISQDREADAAWRGNGLVVGKSIQVSKSDLVAKAASFLCRFRYEYGEAMFIATNDFITLNEEVPGPQGEDAYKVEVYSTNGIMFRTGTQHTTLVARVYRGTSEITEQLSSAAFRWKRTSESAIGDAAWNSAHETGYKEVILTPADFIGRTSFTCEIKEVS